MIVRDKPTKLELAFAVRGSIIPAIATRLMLLFAVAIAMVWAHHNYPGFPELEGTGFTVFGIALSLFLGFRNNAAYDRWWEARKLWGGLLADLRSLARELDIFETNTQRRHDILHLALAFIHLHRASLRGLLPDDAEATRHGGQFVTDPHPPESALNAIATLLARARQEGSIDGFGAKALGERIASIALQQAGCERIANTPLPFVYSLLIYRTTYLYCLLLPLALIGTAGWLTPIFVVIVGYVFLGLAEVTEDLSHPFGTTPNALPLDAISRTAEICLAPHLGEQPPEPLQAIDYYLS